MNPSTEPVSFSFGDFGNSEASKPFSFKKAVTPSSSSPPPPSVPFPRMRNPKSYLTFASSRTPGISSEKPLVNTTDSDIGTVKTTGKIIEKHEQAFFEWEIPDFLQQDAKVIHSPQFSFSNNAWYVNLYPKIEDDCMSISLSKEDIADGKQEGTANAKQEDTAEAKQEDSTKAKQEDTTNAKQVPKDTIFTFALKKSNGTLKWKELVKFYSVKTINFGKNLSWKRQELIKQESEFLPLGALTVAFSVQEGGAPYSSSEPMKGLESLSSNFRDLFLTKTLWDVTIKVKDAEFQAHECILVARSPLFASELWNSENKSNVINIDDCDPYSFGDFLQYLYTGEIEDISFKTAYGLYSTADKYNVRELKLSCISYMVDNLTVDKVCDVIVLANQHDETVLMSSAEDYFCRNYSKIVSTFEWEELLKTNYRLANKVLKRVVSRAEFPKD